MWYLGIVLFVLAFPTLLVVAMLICYGAASALRWGTDPAHPFNEDATADVPRWEAVPVEDETGVFGWKVRWSQPGRDGAYLWVGHYHAGPDCSLGHCEVMARSDARRKNEAYRMPWEWEAWQNP